ncbi:MAG: DUF5011 domain-containing protein, partial [Acidimicrobiia bacterium]|nr:DUF5011 domain-containing protein [Acidimicrobiia bacterium]
LDAAPGTYRIEFFANPGGTDPSGHGEGESLVGSVNASPGLGLTHSFPGAAGDSITATATFISGTLRSTSEFSPVEPVTDGTAPIITLTGANPQPIEVGSPYVELGATASDDVDGDITGSIVIDATTVDTAVLGSYPVTYDVSDSSGNAAATVTRTVNVVDTTAPVITLTGANPQVVEAGSPYVELGATATDNYDGDISGSIAIDSSAVDTAALGSYPVDYDVSDSSGNAALTVTRTVNVVDTTAPVITLTGANPQTIQAGSPYVELGATATDNYDGDLTASIIIDATAVDTSVLGSYAVAYDVTDTNGNAATTVTRTVNVVDTTAPVITLTGANPQTIEIGSPYIELGATATDNYDGDLTASIIIDATAVDTSTVGVYAVTYEVSDSSGNLAIRTRSVRVVDTNDPPVLAPISDRTAAELTLVTFVASASDPEGDAISYSLLGGPGNAAIDPDSGVFTWTPNEAQGPGSYTFDVVATDDGTPSQVATETVTITVLEINRAPVVASLGSRTSAEGDLIFVRATATDLDLPANSLTFTATNLPPGIAISSSGVISGEVAGGAAATSPYSVRVSVSDNGVPALSSSVSFTWTIETASNEPPAAADDVYSMPYSGQLVVGSPGVLANDIDLDGDALGSMLITPPALGELELNPDGSFSYTSLPGQTQPATFTYRIDDQRGGTDTAVVTIFMAANRDPIASPNAYVLDTFGRHAMPVMTNDSDPDGDALRLVEVVTTGTHGDVVIRDDIVDYYPQDGWIGDDYFAYVIEDSAGNSAVGHVHVVIRDEAGGNGERFTAVVGSPEAVWESPSNETVAAGIGLNVTISLISSAFWQSLDALRLPLVFLALAVLAVLLLGGITEAPVFLAASRRKFWSVVMVGREATLTVHVDPDQTADVIYNYAPTSTGIMSIDRPHRGYMPVDSPRGNGWVDMDHLTPATDLEYFMRDQRPIRLVEELRNVLDEGGDFSKLVSHRGYAIAIGAEMVKIPQHLAIASRAAVAAGNVPAATADLQEQVLESIRQALLDLADVSAEMAHSPSALIPTELWNFPYLAIHSPGHSNWLIHFEYEEKKPYIVGISLDQ